MKEQGFLLGANAIRKSKTGEPLDFGVLRIAMKDSDGKGWQSFEFTYGNANNADHINKLVSSSPLPCEMELTHSRDYRTGQLTLRLLGVIVQKQDGTKNPF